MRRELCRSGNKGHRHRKYIKAGKAFAYKIYGWCLLLIFVLLLCSAYTQIFKRQESYELDKLDNVSPYILSFQRFDERKKWRAMIEGRSWYLCKQGLVHFVMNERFDVIKGFRMRNVVIPKWMSSVCLRILRLISRDVDKVMTTKVGFRFGDDQILIISKEILIDCTT